MITLASDFGEPYPAAMRGVLLRRSDARLADVSHDLPRGDVRGSAFWLRFLLPEFPPAVHLVVVDPGVGTDRDAIVLRAGDHALVGPDNGVLLPAARALAAGVRASDRGSVVGPGAANVSDPDAASVAEPDAESDAREADDASGTVSTTSMSHVDAFRIRVPDPASSTFHGRDVFAPAAATAHDTGVDDLSSASIFQPIDEVVDLALPPARIEDDRAEGEVLAVDDFGNVITNVPGSFLREAETVHVDGDPTPVGATFASVPRGQRLVTVGSHGYLECDVNDGRGAEAFDLAAGDPVRVER
ncbi:MAG: SAM hydrolase/SAM-dependent halogenase family protein [Haloferacaceae archaeon]